MRAMGLVLAIVIFGFAGGAAAQGEPRVGIAMGYPASVGIIWQATDRVALRPEISLLRASGESTTTSLGTVFTIGGTVTTTTTTSVTTNDAWSVGIGLSALFYLSKHDALRTYLSPRWAYTRSSISSSSSTGLPSGLGTGARSTTNVVTGSTGHFVAGSVGAQYALGRRFSVFGEVGLGFTRTVAIPNADSPAFTLGESVSRSLSTRSGAGVVLYF